MKKSKTFEADYPKLAGDAALSQIDDIEDLIRRSPGMSEIEIARGPEAYQQLVNQHCRRLAREGRVKREGRGGFAEPFTYHPSKLRS